MSTNLLFQNLLFFVTATSFFIGVGWAWRNSKHFTIPQPLPSWFKVWLFTVLTVGIAVPLLAIIWGGWKGYSIVYAALVPYLVMLGLQILSESVAVNQYHSIVWVSIPCLYLPYRIWQLYQGLTLFSFANELVWLRYLLLLEIVLWICNYGVHLSQLPRLLRWEVVENTHPNL